MGAPPGNIIRAAWEGDIIPERLNFALCAAAAKGELDVVRMLLEARADLEDKDDEGHTALLVAVLGGHVEALPLLLSARADVEAKDHASGTILQAAVKQGHLRVVQLLLQARADLEAKYTGRRRTLLQTAVERGHVDVVQHLLQARADLEAKDDEGQTVLHVVVRRRNVGVMRQLLAARADVDAKDLDGRSCWFGAAGDAKELLLLMLSAVRVEVSLLGGKSCQCEARTLPEVVEKAEEGLQVKIRLLVGPEAMELNMRDSLARAGLKDGAVLTAMVRSDDDRSERDPFVGQLLR